MQMVPWYIVSVVFFSRNGVNIAINNDYLLEMSLSNFTSKGLQKWEKLIH